MAVVLDCGSGNIKAGFSGNENPLCVFPTVLGRPRNTTAGASSGTEQPPVNNTLYGQGALKKRGLLSLRYPIEHGIIVNWDDMERLWSDTFSNELRIIPDGHNLFLTEATLNPRANREKSTEIMFEKFNIETICFGSQSTLALYASGRTIGLVLQSGEGVTHCIPIYEGYSLPQAILRMDLGGRDVTDQLCKLLSEKGHSFVTAAEREIVREIKEKMCFVAIDVSKETRDIEMTQSKEEKEETEISRMKYSYELPDGHCVNLGPEMCASPEILFNPNTQQIGLSQLVYESIMKTEVDLRRVFFRNIILNGGNTMFEGMKERLNDELIHEHAPKTVTVKVNASKDRKYSVWMGASIISELSSFRENWFNKKDYDENGVHRVHQMCI